MFLKPKKAVIAIHLSEVRTCDTYSDGIEECSHAD